jgi:thiol:disulfide interchange protein DsbD
MSLTENLAQSLRGSLASGDFWIALAAAWLGGLLTAFTPCVYPLIPITIRYFGGMQKSGRGRTLARAFVYVGGMILLYATLGTLFASFHAVFGSFLSSPLVVGAIALFCAAMGASILGLFTLQLPVGLNTRLSQLGGQSLGGAFVMGLVSGIIAAPCTGPVLAVILTLIATSGAVSVGFALMTAFGLGLGLPFLVLALSSGMLTRLPQSGTWMELVKAMLATAMFVVAIYFLQVAWPDLRGFLQGVQDQSFLAMILVLTGVFVGGFYLHMLERAFAAPFKALAIVLMTSGLTLALLGGDLPPPSQRDDAAAGIAWETGHEAGLARARAQHKPVMIDFTAEWCQACKELERETYVDARVRAEVTRFVAIKLDATELDDAMNALFQRYAVLGLPTVVFIDSSGNVLREPRVTGFVPAERFFELLAQVH